LHVFEGDGVGLGSEDDGSALGVLDADAVAEGDVLAPVPVVAD
jgi:hypothetical protein